MSATGRCGGRPPSAQFREIELVEPIRPSRRRQAIITVPLDANGVPDLIAMRNAQMAKALEDCSTFDMLLEIARTGPPRERLAAIREIHRLQEMGIKMQMLAAGLDPEGGPVGSPDRTCHELEALKQRVEDGGE